MSGRRSYQRYAVNNASGHLRVIRDVTMWRGIESEFFVVSDEPEAAGELLLLERMVNGTTVSLEVSVIDGHPVIANGRVRHQLRVRSEEVIATRHRSARRAH